MADQQHSECRRILFVCTGNTCRSPMAETLLRDRLGPDSGWTVASAGIAACEGATASPESHAVLTEWELDLAEHCSRPLTAQQADAADLLIALARSHYDAIIARFPSARAKTLLLGSFLVPDGVDQDIPDPIGGDLAEYRSVRDQIAKAVDRLAESLHHLV